MFIDSMKAINVIKNLDHKDNKISWLTCVLCFYIHLTITSEGHFIHSFIQKVFIEFLLSVKLLT